MFKKIWKFFYPTKKYWLLKQMLIRADNKIFDDRSFFEDGVTKDMVCEYLTHCTVYYNKEKAFVIKHEKIEIPTTINGIPFCSSDIQEMPKGVYTFALISEEYYQYILSRRRS